MLFLNFFKKKVLGARLVGLPVIPALRRWRNPWSEQTARLEFWAHLRDPASVGKVRRDRGRRPTSALASIRTHEQKDQVHKQVHHTHGHVLRKSVG